MGDLVCDGTEYSCPMCSSKLKLKVAGSEATGEGKKLAHTGNWQLPPPGGMCQLTKSPCVPGACVVSPGQSSVKISGNPALGAGSVFVCKGMPITVASAGQTQAKHDVATAASNSSKPPSSDSWKKVNPDTDSGKAMTLADKQHKLTLAGHSAHKKSQRKGTVFPELKGNPKAKNAAGQKMLEEIVNHPQAERLECTTNRPRQRGGVEIYTPDGRGARFTKHGDFVTFVQRDKKK